MSEEQDGPEPIDAAARERMDAADENERRRKRPGPPKGQGRNPTKDETIKRRELVERWWIEGLNCADIRVRLEKEGAGVWSRQTVWNDVVAMRERWEQEGSKRSRESVKEELERMSRLVLATALTLKKVATRRELDAEGKMKITTVLLPSPDLGAANRAIERIGALHGLNITTLDGQLGVGGLSDFFADLVKQPGIVPPETPPEE